MGNRNSTKTASSMNFSEEEDEEENWTGWLEGNSKANEKFVPSFPGTQILTIQPVYRVASENVAFNHLETKTQIIKKTKPKSRRNRTIAYYTKGKTDFGGIRYQYDDLGSSDEESEERASVTENNNGNKCNRNEMVQSHQQQHTEEPYISNQLQKRGFPTGRVYVSVSYDAITQRLKVTLLKAKNLSCKRTEGKDKCGINCSDSFVKFTLKDDKKELQTHTSAIKKGYSEVLYYENHAFDIENTNLQTLCLEISAIHCSKPHLIQHNHEIGKVVLQGEINENSVVDSQLVEALRHPGQVVYEWHTIRS